MAKKLSLIIVIVFLLVSAMLATALNDFIVPKTWNYKITIEVATPEGVKSGTATRHVEARKELAGYINPSGGVITYRVYGEAVVIDLDNKGLLFSLLDWNSNMLLENAFPTNISGNWPKTEFYSSLEAGEITERTIWKSFVWLPEINSQENLQRLDSKEFSEKLGSEYSLVKTIVEITDEPITWKIKPILEKLKGRFGKYHKESFQFKK